MLLLWPESYPLSSALWRLAGPLFGILCQEIPYRLSLMADGGWRMAEVSAPLGGNRPTTLSHSHT